MQVNSVLVLAVCVTAVSGCVVVPGGSDTYPHQPAGYHREVPFEVPPPFEAPPKPLLERRPGQPSSAYVWQDGYWDWDGIRYIWRSGTWVVAPPGKEWVQHQWVHSSKRGWVLFDGFWRDESGH